MDHLLVFLYSLVGPFLSWLLESFLPYPHIVEEVFKLAIVFAGGRSFSTKNGLYIYAFCGFLFALTELTFYSTKINLSGNLNLFFLRMAATTTLHSLTFVILFLTYKKDRRLVFFGFLAAVLTHFLYNSLVSSL
jgi:hypothetical protein